MPHEADQHWCKDVDGVWKFADLAPEIKWGEIDWDEVFASGLRKSNIGPNAAMKEAMTMSRLETSRSRGRLRWSIWLRAG